MLTTIIRIRIIIRIIIAMINFKDPESTFISGIGE